MSLAPTPLYAPALPGVVVVGAAAPGADVAPSDKKSISLGTKPLQLVTFTNKGVQHVFAGSDRPTIIYSNNGKLLYSNLNEDEVRSHWGRARGGGAEGQRALNVSASQVTANPHFCDKLHCSWHTVTACDPHYARTCHALHTHTPPVTTHPTLLCP